MARSFLLISLGILAGVASSLTSTTIPADKDFLTKQNEILMLFNKVHELNFYEDQAKIGREYDPLAHLSDYKNSRVVQELVKDYKNGRLLARGEIFNLFDDEHRREMILAFETLFFSKDWDTFFKTAAYLRDKINEGQFVYALSVAVFHRPDTRGVILPPEYETYPHLFVTSKVIHEAYAAKMRQEPAFIQMNFTGTIRNPEQRIAYFGEDVGMNSHHAIWHKDFPFWWKDEYYGVQKDRKGELFFWMHHQLLARFNAERLSNDLNEVEPLAFDKPIVLGFYPQTTYRKGGEFPARPDNFQFQDLPELKIRDMEAFEDRIRESIAAGFVLGKDLQTDARININNTDGINILGSIIEASASSVNPEYYGSIHNLGHIMLGRIVDPLHKFGMPPGVMEHFETATRDPAFFRLHKYIDNLFKEHKDSLQPYAVEELDFEGVDITNVEVDELKTYFEEFDIDLLNALDDAEGLPDVEIKARVQRLNHKAFGYKITVNADASKTSTVRIFIAPKKDWYGTEIALDVQRWNYIELDRFAVKLSPGENHIVRKSSESSVSIPDRPTTKVLRKQIEDAIEGTKEHLLDKDYRHCGLPDRLLLPKGKVNGQKYTLFVMLTDHDEDKVNTGLPHDYEYGGSTSYCGTTNNKNWDKRPFGFPFDRKIPSVNNFKVSNMFFRDVEIKFHPNHVA